MALKRCIIALVLGASLGCFGNESTAFPPGIEPLDEEHRAPNPAALENDPHPEVVSMVDGEVDDYHWVHATTYVKAPIEVVYEAVREYEINVDRRRVDAWDLKESDVEPEYEYSYKLYSRVDDIITVEYDVVWRLGSMLDEDGELSGVRGRWQKVWGSEVIGLLRGSLELEPVDGQTTVVRVIKHLDALQGRGENARTYVTDFLNEIHLYTRGESLPTY